MADRLVGYDPVTDTLAPAVQAHIDADIAAAGSNYVAAGGSLAQTITGLKNFTTSPTVNGAAIGGGGGGGTGGAIVVAAGSTAAQINTAIAGAPSDAVVMLVGAYTTTSTIVVTSHLDASAATIHYTGTGVAVQVGTSTAIPNKSICLPAVINEAKTVLGWSQVAGSVGVKLLNLASCIITVPNIQDFGTGLLCRGEGTGMVHNVITLGGLHNNTINLQLDANATGWTNQNQFLGGRLSYESTEGSNIAGTRMIQMLATTSVINTNLFVGTSVEGSGPEWNLDVVAGIDNEFYAMRWETAGGARVRWGAGAIRNSIVGGYSADQIVTTNVAGAVFNNIRCTLLTQFFGSSSDNGIVRLNNGYSAAAPVLAISDTTDFAAWTWRHTAQQIQGKRPGDAFPRVTLDAVNGKLICGTGDVAAPNFLQPLGGGGWNVNGHIEFQTDGVDDIGAAGGRPRYIRASAGIQSGAAATGSRPAATTAGAGAMFYDTTLGKPIWSNGTVWKDATGTTV